MTGARLLHRPWAGLLVIVVVALLAGCGLSANRAPQVIASKDLPADLLDPNQSTSTTLGQSPTTTSVLVYFLVQADSGTRLVAVPRSVKDGSRPRDRLVALLVPPTADEQARGLLTSIPADTSLLDTKLTDGELVIDLSRSLFDIQGQELRNAFAQLVWTATEIPGVKQVRFLVAGKEYRVPDENGIEQPGAVTRANYLTLAPAPTTTTPAAPTTLPGATTLPTTTTVPAPTTAPTPVPTTVPGPPPA